MAERERGGFIDQVRIFLKAGKGGDGCAAMRREKYVPYGGPNGGNGGEGGDIVLRASAGCNTLTELSFHPHVISPDGGNGKGKNLYGRNGEDTIIPVPAGTMVLKDGRVVADLRAEGDSFLAAKGGRGGRGNVMFKTQFNTAPMISEKGEPGEESALDLELSLLADVGLAGFPNAGKSTLLSRVSAARPKIAAYPFTTLNPNLGVVTHKYAGFVVADIPGLIEGAHEGKGLGDDFLRHILRTRLIIQLVDPQGFGGVTPEKSVKVIASELSGFNPELGARKRLLAVTKADLPEAAGAYASIKKKFKKDEVFLISGVTGEGVSKLMDRVIELLPSLPVPELYKPEEKGPVLELRMDKGFRVENSGDNRWNVRGPRLKTLLAMTNFVQPDSLERLRRIFKGIGLDKALKKAGAAEGDIVSVEGWEFEWQDPLPPAGRIGKFAYKYKHNIKLEARRKKKFRKSEPPRGRR
ncbi:MAG: GTP-binding protein [Elusimicrobia bacterium]|nr:MAG: GTP-binding protein [Elusimicrobiota bacterium]KAF0154847.1 MAG: GTP-binding protein [Elusimicrobiota bacterium]